MKNRPVLRRSVIFAKQLEHPPGVFAFASLRLNLGLAEAGDCEAGRNDRGGIFGQSHINSLRAGFEHLHDSGRGGAGNGGPAA